MVRNVRRGRAQTDHPHLEGILRSFRRQVRRRHQPRHRPRHSDHRAGRQLRDWAILKHGRRLRPERANQTILTPAGDRDIFVAKYDPDGALVWATRAGGTEFGTGLGIATTRLGDSYVTGPFRGMATFGQDEPNETTLTSAGETDIFVAKYDQDGALLWAIRAGGAGFDEGLGISTTRLGDSYYVTGRFSGTATFGEGDPNQTTLTSAAGDEYEDIFVAKYDPDGALVWATRAGGAALDLATGAAGIATTQRGDSYVTGVFGVRAIFGEGERNETTLTSTGSPPDIFVARYR